MAKVKITGHASGTGVLTVTAPNTSTDRTITLPDATGTLATTADTTDLDGAITINESGADADFRVESDTKTHALFVQGSDGNVGIGQATPSSANSIPTFLHIGNSSTTQSSIILEDDESKWEMINNGDIAFRIGGTAHFRVGSDQIQNGTGVYKINALTTAGTTAGWNFDSSGATNISITSGASAAITTSLNGSGMILANDTSLTGETAIFVTGGGQMDLIGGTSNSIVASDGPNSSQIGFYVSGGKAYVKNGMSGTLSLNMQTFRTRSGQ